MIYGLLGDITIFLHFLWVLFILLGVLLVRRHRLLLQVHLAGLIFTIVINVGGWFCPLTYLENYLYGLYDPKLAYSGSFISQYLQKLIYMNLDEFYLRTGAILWSVANLVGYILLFRKKKSFAGQRLRSCLLLMLTITLTMVISRTALASYITLQISATPVVRDQQLECSVSIVNQGDEAATNVQIHLEYQGQRHSSPDIVSLDVLQKHAASFSLPLTGLPPGRHPIAISVDYRDKNGYPFTALSFAFFILGEDHPPRIHGVIEEIELRREATLEYRIKNLDAKPRKLKIRLFLPKEISATQAESRITLEGSTEQTIRFQLHNFSALPGSTYPVFVLSEYDEQGKHSTLFTQGVVKIVASRDFFRTYRLPLLIGIVLLCLLLVGLQFFIPGRK